jgi:hypothetical protein
VLLPGLASNHNPLLSASWITGIIGMKHHTRLLLYLIYYFSPLQPVKFLLRRNPTDNIIETHLHAMKEFSFPPFKVLTLSLIQILWLECILECFSLDLLVLLLNLFFSFLSIYISFLRFGEFLASFLQKLYPFLFCLWYSCESGLLASVSSAP